VYSESEELWRMDLAGVGGTRRRIHGTGQPLDVSRDGKLLLTARTRPGAQWTFDQELWVSEIGSDRETQLATGNSATFLGPKSTHVLFFVGYDSIPYVTTVDGKTRTRIECAPTYKMWPRVCRDGSGVVLGTGLKNGRPEYDVIFIDFVSLRATTIASIGCGSVTFRSPTGTKDGTSLIVANQASSN
jgi:hypothetical protein